ncbi:hypothetical protein [Candidatus Nitrospira nitrificans]|uniref:Uncharacterized protein n=1 Tax=Candidatus Nitrospira nitrificans TaxID=1742973 RepID=A0A0S4LLU8_9BACT|nr:hypothetical protein [Candidatus Nitrospira nitrificans]CUS37568.1 conserved exported hypothetical protein [Candidatus Nitrospira nitrificans]
MNRLTIARSIIRPAALISSVGMLCLLVGPVLAQSKSEKAFHAVAVDAKSVETDVKNVVFYYEEKISETAFVPHEMRELPVKRGTATVKIKFDGIKHIDLKPTGNGSAPNVTITLNDGKTGEFILAVAGSFKGQSDFGEVELPAAELKKLTFK